MTYKIAFLVHNDGYQRRGYIYDFRTCEQPEKEFETDSLTDAYAALEAARAYANKMGYDVDTTYTLVKITTVEAVID